MIANKDGGVPRRTAATKAARISPYRGSPYADDLDRALDATQRRLLDEQHSDGYWVGELQGDSILESEYILLMAFLEREPEEICVKACKYLHAQQLPEGAWAIYP